MRIQMESETSINTFSKVVHALQKDGVTYQFEGYHDGGNLEAAIDSQPGDPGCKKLLKVLAVGDFEHDFGTSDTSIKFFLGILGSSGPDPRDQGNAIRFGGTDFSDKPFPHHH